MFFKTSVEPPKNIFLLLAKLDVEKHVLLNFPCLKHTLHHFHVQDRIPEQKTRTIQILN